MFDITKLSRFELIWIWVIFWAIVFTAIEATFSYTFDLKFLKWQLWSEGILSILFTCDLIYHIKKYQKKKQQRKISYDNQYKTRLFFTIDVLACIPFDLILWVFGISSVSRFVRLFRIIRLIRLVKLLEIFDKLSIIPRYIKIQIVLISVLLVMHFVSCIWILIHPYTGDTTLIEYYVKAFYWAVTTLTTVGYGDITPVTIIARVYTMIVMIIGVGFYGIIIGNISRIMAENARYKEQTKEKFSELDLFMKHYHIPNELQSSVFNYYNHIYSKHLSDNDQKIIGELPAALKNELQVYMKMKLIRNLPVFKFCSLECLKEVAAALSEENFAPGDRIINIGDLGDEMYIIGHGSVDISLKDDKVIASSHEGQFFGEAALLSKTERNANVTASGYCDLYKLSKQDFLRILEIYPELLESVESLRHK